MSSKRKFYFFFSLFQPCLKGGPGSGATAATAERTYKPQEKLHDSGQGTKGQDLFKAEGEEGNARESWRRGLLIIYMTRYKSHREKGGCAYPR